MPPDTVYLPGVEDDYGHLSWKTQHSLRWADFRNYDFAWRAFPDTYCRPERLMSSGFEASDFRGDFRNEHCNRDNYASGGPGYFLSRKAYKLLLDAPITGVHRVSEYAEDLWVGQIFARNPDVDLKYFDDPRFINKGTNQDGPLATNNIISTHLSYPDRYFPGKMKEKHQAWLKSLAVAEESTVESNA